MNCHDVIIIGGGPGGLAAGIYAARAKLSTLIIEKGRFGGQAASTEEMENYPGFFQGTTGPQLAARMEEHARHFGCGFCKDEVVDLELDGWEKAVITKKGRYTAKAVIIAAGAEPRTLGIPGETEFRGRGVSYCATCDADFYEDLAVVVVGNGDAAIEEAIYLTRFAAKVTIVVVHDPGVLDATKVIQERALANEKIHWVWNSVLVEVKGEGVVQSVALKNLKTGAISDLETDGVFIFVGTVPKTEFMRGKVALDGRGYILANEQMETSLAGVYAVGDVRQKYLRQVVTAAADGAVAAVAAEKYLEEEENFRREVLERPGVVAVLFWSPFHEESLAALPLIEDYALEKGDRLDLVKVDTYRNQRVARRYNVAEMPALLLFKGGKILARISGAFTREDLDSLANTSQGGEG